MIHTVRRAKRNKIQSNELSYLKLLSTKILNFSYINKFVAYFRTYHLDHISDHFDKIPPKAFQFASYELTELIA